MNHYTETPLSSVSYADGSEKRRFVVRKNDKPTAVIKYTETDADGDLIDMQYYFCKIPNEKVIHTMTMSQQEIYDWLEAHCQE